MVSAILKSLIHSTNTNCTCYVPRSEDTAMKKGITLLYVELSLVVGHTENK